MTVNEEKKIKDVLTPERILRPAQRSPDWCFYDSVGRFGFGPDVRCHKLWHTSGQRISSVITFRGKQMEIINKEFPENESWIFIFENLRNIEFHVRKKEVGSDVKELMAITNTL